MDHPAVFAIRPPDAAFALGWFAALNSSPPRGEATFEIIRMKDRGPLPATKGVQGETQVIQPPFVQEVDKAIRSGRINQRGSGVDQATVIVLAAPQNLLSPPGLGDISDCTDELKTGGPVLGRAAHNAHMLDCAVGQQQAMFEIELAPLTGDALDELKHYVPVFRVSSFEDPLRGDSICRFVLEDSESFA